MFPTNSTNVKNIKLLLIESIKDIRDFTLLPYPNIPTLKCPIPIISNTILQILDVALCAS